MPKNNWTSEQNTRLKWTRKKEWRSQTGKFKQRLETWSTKPKAGHNLTDLQAKSWLPYFLPDYRHKFWARSSKYYGSAETRAFLLQGVSNFNYHPVYNV